jgi:ubiquinone/menaquinone biosynthesis C-methylase UbiE
MSSVVDVNVRCPDCGKALGPLTASLSCLGCGRRFEYDDGAWDLLPSELGRVKLAEDRLHVDEGVPTWRRLFYHKRYWLEWCDRDWMPRITGPSTRRFLEIGGGLCYASALVKARCPGATVVASDVSPRYVRTHAKRAGGILGTPADVYAAVDAENLPFEDGQFDAIYSQLVLYRLQDPVRALSEIRRVLARGGRYLGIERASPWAPPFREDHVMSRRNLSDGVSEKAIRFAQWQEIARKSGLGGDAVAPVLGRRVTNRTLRRLGNAVRQIYVEITIAA